MSTTIISSPLQDILIQKLLDEIPCPLKEEIPQKGNYRNKRNVN